MSSPERSRALRVLGTVLYWLAVTAISLVLVVALILFLESRDQSEVESEGATIVPMPAQVRMG